MSTIAAVLGRLMIGAYFIVSGAIILLAPTPSDALFAAAGFVPGIAFTVGLFEVIAGLALALGFATRTTALLLAVWTVISVLTFHGNVTEPAQVPEVLAQVAVLGGLFLVFAHSQVWWSLDSLRNRRAVDLAEYRANTRARDAELAAQARTHEAELRAARAEGTAKGVTTGVVNSGVVNGGNTATVARRRWF